MYNIYIYVTIALTVLFIYIECECVSISLIMLDICTYTIFSTINWCTLFVLFWLPFDMVDLLK